MGMPDEASVVAFVREDPRYQELFARAFPDNPMPIRFNNLSGALGAFFGSLTGRVDREYIATTDK